MEAAIKKNLLFRSTLYKDIDSSLISQLSAIAEQQGLEAKSLAAAFDKFMTVQRQDNKSVTVADIESFRNEHLLRKSLASARGTNLFHKGTWDDVTTLPLEEGGQPRVRRTAEERITNNRITPYMTNKTRANQRTPPSSDVFKQRQNAGHVLATLNPHNISLPEAMDLDGEVEKRRRRTAPAVTLYEHLSTSVEGQPNDKYMCNRIEDRATYIENRIQALEDAFTSLESGDGGTEGRATPAPVAAASQEPAVFVGRICCDAEEGRLNPQSLLLEGSMRCSHGERVRLDVTKCSDGFRLIPGQCIVVRGTNPSGHCIIAKEILGGLPLDLPKTPRSELLACRSDLRLMCASGPFTARDDLAYEPLAALLERAASREESVDVLILSGPFVDVEHPLLRNGLIDETFQGLFEDRVISPLERFVSETGATVVLQPSVRDLHAHPVFPQPRCVLSPALLYKKKRMQGEIVSLENPKESIEKPLLVSAPNPVTVSCHERTVISTSAEDWLLAASGLETSLLPNNSASSHTTESGHGASHLPAKVDRLGELSKIVLLQRNVFPAFPPPLHLPLDASKAAEGGLSLPCSPDVLILPSDLAPFAKSVSVKDGGQNTVVIINPGRLTKGSSGGTFARIHIAAYGEGENCDLPGAGENVPVPHHVASRCRVDIVRL